ncbi:MAG: SOS response-associated protein YedK [Chroococcidiopsis sp. SAG 2025]|uniref:SOS response-associated peptidase n=1 Tax=Chroococcidiopsis sp. SAG 2025 TaxID=171389 RepID=UPI0029374A27|nr:SOS response-associated peptidase [Chroococcidiopsis sp. SAG 2025]MDV2994370.1 SOS response-associated protein YedK [Chroococcidiopsis sp. SAG 2025]
MCGRFTLSQPAEAIASTFQLSLIPELAPRYNIAPTQPVPTILSEGDRRRFQMLRWGLIPSWAKDASMGAKLINARAETVAEKPAFRSAFRRRRCLVVADGFYEWQLQKSKKQPFYFRLQDGQPFAFAGLWETWQAPDGEKVDSCTLLTTTANSVLRSVHDRMPVILKPEDYNQWLDPQTQEPEQLKSLLQPYSSEAMVAYPVSTKVNNPTNESPECIERQPI